MRLFYLSDPGIKVVNRKKQKSWGGREKKLSIYTMATKPYKFILPILHHNSENDPKFFLKR